MNKIDKPLANLTEMRKKKSLINKIRIKSRESSSTTSKIYIEIKWKI
jgi:hypothetical protein